MVHPVEAAINSQSKHLCSQRVIANVCFPIIIPLFLLSYWILALNKGQTGSTVHLPYLFELLSATLIFFNYKYSYIYTIQYPSLISGHQLMPEELACSGCTNTMRV